MLTVGFRFLLFFVTTQSIIHSQRWCSTLNATVCDSRIGSDDASVHGLTLLDFSDIEAWVIEFDPEMRKKDDDVNSGGFKEASKNISFS